MRPKNRSAHIKRWKSEVEKRHGHEMGNVVNCAPVIHPGITVSSRCRKCGKAMLIIWNEMTDSWGAQGSDVLLKDCKG